MKYIGLYSIALLLYGYQVKEDNVRQRPPLKKSKTLSSFFETVDQYRRKELVSVGSYYYFILLNTKLPSRTRNIGRDWNSHLHPYLINEPRHVISNNVAF